MMNAINLPLALITVVLRRYIDKIFTPQGEIVLNNAPWLIEPSLFKLCMYAYMFSAGLWYTLKNMRKGTIISIAKKCSGGAINIKDKCARKKCLDKNRKSSWMMDNLMKNRESQQRALQYVSTLTPHPQSSSRISSMGEPSRYRETLNRKSTTSVRSTSNKNILDVNGLRKPSLRNEPVCNDCVNANPYYSSFNRDPVFENHEFCQNIPHCTCSANNQASSNEQQSNTLHAPNAFQHRGVTDRNFPAFNGQQVESYGSNPYYEPKIFCTCRNPCPCSNPRLSNPNPGQGPSKQPQLCSPRCCVQPNTGDIPCTWRSISDPTISKRAVPANELSELTITGDSLSALLKLGTKAKIRRKKVPPVRNFYTLRGRKINVKDPSHVGKTAGKTRSGKVYNYHSNKSRRKNSEH